MNKELIEKYYYAIKPYITNEAKTCSYCDKIDSLIIYRGRYFYITCAIGAYMPGYIQLCSYMHRTSATGIRTNEYAEFDFLSQVIRKCFKKAYGHYGIAFEHGQAGTCLWKENHVASLCHHMHVHFIPVELDVHKDISALFSDFIIVNGIEDMVKVRQEILCAEPYLYFSDVPERGYMYNVSGLDVPRQFLRRCVANKLGIAEKADWQEYPGVEYCEKTFSDLSAIIKEETDKWE